MNMNVIYQNKGFSSRVDYIQFLSDEYGVPFQAIADMAYLLGSVNDFDTLVDWCEDYAIRQDVSLEESSAIEAGIY